MRIGIDARLWGETGVGRYIRNLIKYLQILDQENEYVLFATNKDYDSLKFEIRNSPASPSEAGRAKFEIIRASARWHSFREQWEIPKILNKEKLDLVHFPYFNVPIFYRGPFVVTIHDLIINHFPTGRATTLPWPVYQIKRLGYKLALGFAIKKSKKIITVSEATKKEIVDHFNVNPSKIVVTYESGELPAISHQPSVSRRIKKPYFLYVGNANPHKNLERLLEAISKTCLAGSPRCEAGRRVKLVLVGREDYFYQRLKKKVEGVDLDEEVVFYGEASDVELQALYKNAQALILPSLMEGFGLPAVEAMSQGCLVLASDIPALREICGEAAIYFDPYNTNDIVEKIKLVMEDGQQKQKLTKLGLELAERFSWKKLAKETLAVYNSFGS